MIIYDIVRAVKANIPFYTDRLTDQFSILSFTFDEVNKKYIIQTSPVPVGSIVKPISVENNEVTIASVLLKNPISSVTYSSQTQSALLTFENQHFVTMNIGCQRYFNPNYRYFKEFLPLDYIITLADGTNPEWNGNFAVSQVIDSLTLEIVFFTIPSITTPVLNFNQIEFDNPLFNFLSRINFISPNNFEIPILTQIEPFNGWIVDSSSAIIMANHRITGVYDIDISNSAYTKQFRDHLYIFAMKGDSSGESTFASQSRTSNLDSTDVRTINVFYTQNIIERFSLNLFIPSTYYIGARQSVDIAEIFKPIIFKSILGVRFPSIYTSGMEGNVTYIRDSAQFYNSAYYVHSYYFERIDSINIGDCVDRTYNYPIEFINLNYIGKQNGDIILTDNIDLREDS